jgi:hypothetical protein
VRADIEMLKENADPSPKKIMKKSLRIALALAFINTPVKVTCSISTRFRTLQSKGHTLYGVFTTQALDKRTTGV